MHSAVYPVLGNETRLPFYLSGIGRTEPEFHVKRDKGLTSHQFLFTAKGSSRLCTQKKNKLKTISIISNQQQGEASCRSLFVC